MLQDIHRLYHIIVVIATNTTIFAHVVCNFHKIKNMLEEKIKRAEEEQRNENGR